MNFSDLRTVDVLRPGVGRRYTMLPVDHIDITGFHASYEGSPLRPGLVDIVVGDRVAWSEKGVRYQALVDEVVIDQAVLRVAFRDAEVAAPEW